MRRNTPKRAKQEREYAKLRRQFLDANPWCQYPLECGEPATEVHHRKGRVGALLLNMLHWSALCHDHHRYVTEHPQHAYELGISERRVSA